MEQALVTVVLPIYNVEKYLERCIYSIVNQTYKNLEILLVDDGSLDNCPKMCDEWALKDSRIRVIHKTNEGLGMARNTGIENATGEYICFFDSDDYVELTAIEKIYECISLQNSDVAVFGVTTLDAFGNKLQSFIPQVGNRTYIGAEVVEDFLPDFIAPDPKGDGTRVFYMSSWVLMYSMKLIRETNWRFVSEREIISEDVYSLISLFRYAQSVAVLPMALYYYCDNGASLSRKYIADRYSKIKHFYLESIKLCENLGYGDIVKHRISKPYLAFTLATMKQEANSNFDYKKRNHTVKSIIVDETLQQVLKQNKKDKVSITRKIMFWAMRMKLYGVCMFLLKIRE